MITSKGDYKHYVSLDEENNRGGYGHRPFYIGDEVKKYLKVLRLREYIWHLINNHHAKCLYPFYNLLRYRMKKLGIKLGFDIPINTVGAGFRIDHWGYLVISSEAKVGKNCHCFGDITIGVKDNVTKGAPTIGDNVTIGSGARLLGPIKIASGCTIGANAVVTKSFTDEGSVIVGAPAHIVKK